MLGAIKIILIAAIIIVFISLIVTIYGYFPKNIFASIASNSGKFGAYLVAHLKTLWENIKTHKKATLLIVITFVYFVVSMHYMFQKPGTFGKYAQTSNIVMMIGLFMLLLVLMLEFITIINEKLGKETIKSQLFPILKYIVIIVVLFVLLIGLTYIVSNYKIPSGIFTIIILLVIICIVLYGLYSYVYTPIKNNDKVKKIVAKALSLLSAIGPFFTDLVSGTRQQITGTPRYVYILLLAELGVVLAYFVLPYVRYKFLTHRGKLLMGSPMYTTNMKTIATYTELNKDANKDTNEDTDETTLKYDYHYTVSFWFFPDEQSPSHSSSSNKYTPIFDYGKKPIVLFNPSTSKLQVRMRQGIDGEQIIYTDRIMLQRWNNIVVTYDRGTLDVFINGKLAATKGNVLPYMEYDSMVVGYHKDLEEYGVNGGISNVMYYPDILPLSTIGYNYEHFKNNPRI